MAPISAYQVFSRVNSERADAQELKSKVDSAEVVDNLGGVVQKHDYTTSFCHS